MPQFDALIYLVAAYRSTLWKSLRKWPEMEHSHGTLPSPVGSYHQLDNRPERTKWNPIPTKSHPKVRYCLAINLMRISYCKFMTLWFQSPHKNHPHLTASSASLSSAVKRVWDVVEWELRQRCFCCWSRQAGLCGGGKWKEIFPRLFRFGNPWFNHEKLVNWINYDLFGI